MPKLTQESREGRASCSTDRASTRSMRRVALVKKAKFAKFDETVDLAVRLGVNPKHADQMVRGALVLPHGTGQTVRVLVFAKGEKEREAREAGADFAGSDDMVAKVSEGFMDFDRVIATPDMMGAVGKLGRILGPRGLMPNPKVGTVTFDVGNAVREAKGGKIEYRVEKAGIVHARIGKVLVHRAGALGQRQRRSSTRSSARSPRPRRAPTSAASRSASTMGPGVRDRPGRLHGQDGGGVAMERASKDLQIGEIKSRFDKMTAAVFLDFKGMTVEYATKLRAEFRKAGVEYKVVKNTLVKHALKSAVVRRQAGQRRSSG